MAALVSTTNGGPAVLTTNVIVPPPALTRVWVPDSSAQQQEPLRAASADGPASQQPTPTTAAADDARHSATSSHVQLTHSASSGGIPVYLDDGTTPSRPPRHQLDATRAHAQHQQQHHHRHQSHSHQQQIQQGYQYQAPTSFTEAGTPQAAYHALASNAVPFTPGVGPPTHTHATSRSHAFPFDRQVSVESLTQPILPVETPAPYHSYPHLHFRLPASFVDSWAAASNSPSSASPTPSPSPDASLTRYPALSPASSSSSSSSKSGKPNDKIAYSTRYHVSFRAMHRSDIAVVAALHDELFPVKYDARFYLDLLRPEKVTILAFLEHSELPAPGPDGLVSMPPEPQLIGIATGKSKENVGQCRRWHSGYITTLGVDQRFRRIGLGKFLLKHLIFMIRESERRCSMIFLHVLASNSSAIAMYKSVGFKQYEYLPQHYHIAGEDRDAIKMVKYIDTRKSIYETYIEDEARGWCAIM